MSSRTLDLEGCKHLARVLFELYSRVPCVEPRDAGRADVRLLPYNTTELGDNIGGCTVHDTDCPGYWSRNAETTARDEMIEKFESYRKCAKFPDEFPVIWSGVVCMCSSDPEKMSAMPPEGVAVHLVAATIAIRNDVGDRFDLELFQSGACVGPITSAQARSMRCPVLEICIEDSLSCHHRDPRSRDTDSATGAPYPYGLCWERFRDVVALAYDAWHPRHYADDPFPVAFRYISNGWQDRRIGGRGHSPVLNACGIYATWTAWIRTAKMASFLSAAQSVYRDEPRTARVERAVMAEAEHQADMATGKEVPVFAIEHLRNIADAIILPPRDRRTPSQTQDEVAARTIRAAQEFGDALHGADVWESAAANMYPETHDRRDIENRVVVYEKIHAGLRGTADAVGAGMPLRADVASLFNQYCHHPAIIASKDRFPVEHALSSLAANSPEEIGPLFCMIVEKAYLSNAATRTERCSVLVERLGELFSIQQMQQLLNTRDGEQAGKIAVRCIWTVAWVQILRDMFDPAAFRDAPARPV